MEIKHITLGNADEEYISALEQLDQKTWEKLWLGDWRPECSTRSMNGERCPEYPKYEVDYLGEKLHLCEQCYQRFLFETRPEPKKVWAPPYGFFW